ncbi:MAG: hypothetical protein ACT4PU_04790 [Planctomycetota bacterium]
MKLAAIGEALGAFPALEPSWQHAAENVEPTASTEAERLLDSLDTLDRQLLVLAYGCGMDLGTASYVLGLDTAVAQWRLRSLLLDAETSTGPAALERGLATALRAGPPAQRGARLARRLDPLPEDAAERLRAGLSGARSHSAEDNRPGLGVGSLVLIVLAVAAFLGYGMIEDDNPLWRGQKALRTEQYERARRAFQALGTNPEGLAWTAISHLAEGQFDEAHRLLEEASVAQYLGSFRPVTSALPPVESLASEAALLPRGLTGITRPRFAWLAEAGVVLTLEAADGSGKPLRRRYGEAAEQGVRTVEFPAEWPALDSGTYLWSIAGTAPDAPRHSASFTVIAREQRQEMQRHVLVKLGADVPLAARTYLRAQYDLRSELYTQAGHAYAELTQLFPDQDHPREQLARIAAALAVDPSAFLR